MAWQDPEWVRSDIAGTHRGALRGLVCTGPLILSSEERVPDKESMEDTSPRWPKSWAWGSLAFRQMCQQVHELTILFWLLLSVHICAIPTVQEAQ